MRNWLAMVFAGILLSPFVVLGLVGMAFERISNGLLGESTYWSERTDSPVR